jgi:hypothetical protein
MKLPWPFSLIEKFCRLLEGIPNLLLSGTGGLVLALSLVAGAMIERKDLAVAVAITGTFIGTALLSFFLPKLIYTIKEGELRQAALAKETLIEEQRKRNEGERREAAAKQEIARLEKMRINLDSFRSVLRLGLLEIDMHVTDFYREQLGRTERYKLDPRKNYNTVYMGVFTLPIRATLGIDLAKVRLKFDDKGRIVVSNITPSHVIDTLAGVDWKSREVRNEFIKTENVGNQVVDTIVEVTSDHADPRCMGLSNAHEMQVRKRLKEGQDFKPYETAIIKGAEQTLRAFLTPLEKEIVFSKELRSDGEQILDFLEKHNKCLQITIDDKRKQVDV